MAKANTKIAASKAAPQRKPAKSTTARKTAAAPKKTGLEILFDVVIDHDTGLMWTRGNLPGGRSTFAALTTAAADCRIGGHSDWQLPTPQQALTIVDYTKYAPCVNTDAFPACESAGYWTNTECVFNASYVFVVGFSYGFVYDDRRDGDGYYGRAVRRVSASQ